jgi:hypothetical protein
MNDKETALNEIVALAHANSISSKEIAHALREGTGESPTSSVATRLFAYMGGIFILSGISAFFAMFWNELGTPIRIMSTFGLGMCLYVLALLSNYNKSYTKAVAPLFLISAILETSGFYVAVQELDLHMKWDDTSLLIFGTMLIQYVATYYCTRRTSTLFTAIAFYCLFLNILLDKMHFDTELIFFMIGGSLLCFSYLMDSMKHRSIVGFWYFIGSIAFMGGAFKLLENVNLDIFFIGLGSFLVYVSTIAQSRSLLFTSCVGLLSYIAYFTAENFVDSFGWPIALICLGFIFIGISSLAVRINRKCFERGIIG